MDGDPAFLSTFENAARILGNVGAAVVGLSALAYFIGWHEAFSYYYELGAPWVVNSLSATRLLLESAGLMTVLALFALMSVVSLSERMWQLKHVFRVSTGMAIVGGSLILIATFLSRWLTPSAVFWLSQSAVALFALATALTIAEVVMSVHADGVQWFHRKVWYVFTLLMLGLWQAPDVVGTARAERNANPALSRLPEVISADRNDSGWLLVTTLDGKYLLMKPDITRAKRQFRLMDNLNGWRIGPSRQ
jgi:hypothetical protein